MEPFPVLQPYLEKGGALPSDKELLSKCVPKLPLPLGLSWPRSSPVQEKQGL